MKNIALAILMIACSVTDVWAAGYCGAWGKTDGGTSPWTVSSEIGGTASCAEADVTACVTTHVGAGETLNVPAGECTWTTGITVAKAMTILGATTGCPSSCIAGGTILTVSAMGFTVQASNVSIGQFTFTGAALSGYGVIDVHKAGSKIQNWRLHHNWVKEFNYDERMFYIGRYGGPVDHVNIHTPGLIDGNRFTHSTDSFKIAQVYGGSNELSSWFDDVSVGGTDFVFIENNVVDFTAVHVGVGCFDADVGARYVMRHNQLGHCQWVNHGMEASADPIDAPHWKGVHMWEVYSNIWEDDEDWPAISQFPLWIRGGTGVVWGNRFKPAVAGKMGTPVSWFYQRGDSKTYCLAAGACNGSCVAEGDCDGPYYDGNEADAGGYPCYHQHGTTGATGITKSPIYEWSNYLSEALCTDGSCSYIMYDVECAPQHVQYGRDIIKNGTTAKTGYTPAACPHPLTGIDGNRCNHAVAGLAGYDVSLGNTMSIGSGASMSIGAAGGAVMTLQ